MSNDGRKQYFAAGDFEFTCEEDKHTDGYFGMVEMLSAGIIIYDKDFNIIEKYYSLARPKHNKVLSEFCMTLCGITQDEIDSAPDGVSVAARVIALLDKYKVPKLFVYGDNDRLALFKSALHYKNRDEAQIFRTLSERAKDIRFMFPNSGGLGQVEVMQAWGIEIDPNVHNAMTDAENLFRLLKTYDLNPKPDENILLKQSVIKQNSGIQSREEYENIILNLITSSRFSFLNGKHTLTINLEYAQKYLDIYLKLEKMWGNIDMYRSAEVQYVASEYTINGINISEFDSFYLYKRSNGRAIRATYMLVLCKDDNKLYFSSNNPLFKQLYRECYFIFKNNAQGEASANY